MSIEEIKKKLSEGFYYVNYIDLDIKELLTRLEKAESQRDRLLKYIENNTIRTIGDTAMLTTVQEQIQQEESENEK